MPVQVSAASAPRQVPGLAVGRTAFPPDAGWATVGTAGVCRLLHTADSGLLYHSEDDGLHRTGRTP